MSPEDAEWVLTKGPDPVFYKDNLTVQEWIEKAKKVLDDRI